jgi:hypothetical protein
MQTVFKLVYKELCHKLIIFAYNIIKGRRLHVKFVWPELHDEFMILWKYLANNKLKKEYDYKFWFNVSNILRAL